MEVSRGYKFSLRKKLVFFITSLALITYSTSAFFIYVIYPLLANSIEVSSYTFTVATLMMGIFWSGVLAFIAAGVIIKPLQKLEKTALNAAHGDISKDAEISKSDDEIKSLGIAFNHMLFNLREMVQNIEENFNKTNSKVKDLNKEANCAKEQTLAISLAVKEIAEGSEVSARSVQDTAVSVDEAMELAQAVKTKADSSLEISQNMIHDLTETNQVVLSLIKGMKTLVEENNNSLKSVQKLETNANEVEKIIKLVGDIASQTNLLALNASIEAARAGEHGTGFAVVAEEVRHLADESAKAVEGITELVKGIQSEVKNVVKQMKMQVANVEQESKKGEDANQAFHHMNATIKEMAERVASITELVHQQMEQIYQTSQQSQEVAAVAEQTSACAQQVSNITESQNTIINKVDELAVLLKGQAEELKTTISRFTI
ncbi:methyl-accepting chemotaxis protein [Niallia sp. NCCP-28]|uniref:methyl-accepting chemotaxis protein n=1 Tax=Niallia sp. NCCP-28 TaxID=2934712 RepID=UPI0020893962|nr:HAMP domain-containing methyl-accepting chemotaxis protein [Niallia sp. NCCP-28]GKU83677.1 methyl-accepting chemotaxis protein [Niallia sp. NCCP-28]